MTGPENKELRRFFRFAGFSLAICAVAYLLLISNELTNTHDGMWAGAEYRNYAWVVQIGRWFWPYLGKVQMNICAEPFTSIVTLTVYILGGCIVAFWFGLKDSFRGWLLVLSSVINTAVCVSLSYRYMSLTFGLAYLFSILAVWCLRKENFFFWLLSGVLLTLALGLYQANIGCACVLVLLHVIWMLQNGEEAGKIFRYIGKTIVLFLCTFIVYKIIWDLSLKQWDVEAAAYRGAGDVSVMKIITGLPNSLLGSYQEFYRYFFQNTIKHNIYQRLMPFGLLIICLMLMTLLLVETKLAKKPLLAKLGAVVCLLLIPPAANVAQILAVDSGKTMIQMTLPMATVFPYLLCVTDFGNLSGPHHDSRQWVTAVVTARSLFLLVVLFGSFLMVSVDQHVMLKSRENATAMMNRVAVDLGEDTNPEGGFIFVGRPADNQNFLKDQLWERANEYARYGDFWLDGDCKTQSWFGMLRDAGLSLTFNWHDDYWDEIMSRDEVKTMPVYPDEGYIQKIDRSIVVKIS